MDSIFTAQQFENLNRQLLEKSARASRLRDLRRRREDMGRAMTAQERKSAQRAREHDGGLLPRVRHRRVREACRYDLLKFGLTYCRQFLDHAPSPRMVEKLILPLQRLIRGGGTQVILYPRSTGKTTWMKIAVIWAILYGHKRFAVVGAATKDLAAGILEEIINAFADDDAEMLQKDFPAVALPIAFAEGDAKKMAGVRFFGKKTGMKWSGQRFRFPAVRNSAGEALEESAGAVLFVTGLRGSVKGLNHKKDRPDLILIDDPQNRKIAQSPTELDTIENTIDGDIMGLAGQTQSFSLAMSITPVKQGDLASRYCDKRRHPEYNVSSVPYVYAWPDEAEAALNGFRRAYEEDAATGDFKWQLSRAYYIENRAAFEGVKVLDPENYVHESKVDQSGEVVAYGEIDAIHHLLVLRSRMRDEHFLAEFQLDISGETDETALSPDTVMANLTGVERGVLPTGTLDIVAFIDVNVARKSGLRYQVTAFGPRRLSAVIDYGAYPEDGRALIPPHTDPKRRVEILQQAILHVVDKLTRNRYTLESSGESVHPVAICIDGGYEQKTVNGMVAYIKNNVALGDTRLMWSLGRGWSQFGKKQKNERNEVENEVELKRGDHAYRAAVTDKKTDTTKRFLVFQSDYWREIAQKAFFTRFPAPGSCGLFGKTPSIHKEFADELTYERLVRTYRDEKSGKRAWEWYNSRKGHNHYGDTHYGCFALGAWEKLYTAVAKKIPGSADVKRRKRAKPASIFRIIKRPGAK